MVLQSLEGKKALNTACPGHDRNGLSEDIASAVRHYSVFQFSLCSLALRHTLITAFITAQGSSKEGYLELPMKVPTLSSLRPHFTTLSLLTELREENPPTSLDDDCTVCSAHRLLPLPL